MWTESHGNLARHPKTRRLMQRMGWTLPHTIGNLHLLWWWALEYAPTGDLTKFAPDQLTYDLDLGSASPEQFIEAMIASGFLDKSESGTLRLHDWPDYTAKSLRPTFRRDPEKWHNVLRSYGRPIPPKRPRRTPSLAGLKLPPAAVGEDPNPAVAPGREPSVPPSAKSTGLVDCVERRSSSHGGSEGSGRDRSQNALRAVPYVAQADSATEANSTTAAGNAPEEQAPIPESLDAQPGFSLTWWPKFQEMYKNQGSPLDAWEQGQALAKLAENPPAAVKTLKNSIKTLIARPDLLKRKSIANTS